MFQLPPLPYDYDALEPVVSADTLHYHHDKHHKTYVDTLNKLVAETGETPKSLEDVIKSAEGKLFNNAAQAWNHAFFWHSMTPDKGAPAGDIAKVIEAFGGLADLRKKFVEEGAGHFASGWVWIIADGGALKVISTHDADTPIKRDQTPILVCDVWEHAYYLDYQNDRKVFLEAWFDRLANWRFAEKQLNAAMGSGEPFKYPTSEDSLEEKDHAPEKAEGTARPGNPSGLSA
jgi:Fe-Mn family superoxide dismutase